MLKKSLIIIFLLSYMLHSGYLYGQFSLVTDILNYHAVESPMDTYFNDGGVTSASYMQRYSAARFLKAAAEKIIFIDHDILIEISSSI